MNRGLFERWKPLRADLLLKRESFPRQADVQAEECVREDEGALFVFVSHRWETLAHPDPDHRQFRSVRFLLRCLVRVAFDRAPNGTLQTESLQWRFEDFPRV